MSSFEAVKITNRVYWVGAIDWGLRDFHGYSTSRGTTYNAYLILGDEPILIDTVKKTFYSEMMARIQSVIDPKTIRHIISNHSEMDHSGCLFETAALIQPKKIWASNRGVHALQNHFHSKQELTEVTPGQTLALGNAQFQFIETRMLHWPDSMFTFFKEDGILFSQDAFGMHWATSQLFADENDSAILRYESSKYFANILLPYATLVTKLIKALPEFHLNIQRLAPDHGPIWRTPEDITRVIAWWNQWAKQWIYPKAVICYDTMWGSTAQLADALADGLREEAITVKVLPLSSSHRSDLATEILEAGALLVGSPTMNQQLFPTLADTLCYLKGLKRQRLIGQAFGSYGWSGEAMKQLQKELTDMGIECVNEPFSVSYVPTAGDLARCRQCGKDLAIKLKERVTSQEKH